MTHHPALILTLTGGLTAALLFGYVTHRLRLSPIVGYLLAGLVVGPFTPGFVAHQEIATELAEVGVILLMFGVGLHFSVKDLLAVKRVAIPGALVQSAVATALGTALGVALGWSTGAGIVFGLAISVASTVVLLRVLADYDELHTPAGHVAVGWLVVEDLFTVLVLVLLPTFALSAPSSDGTPNGGAPSVSALALAFSMAILKLGVLVVFTLFVGQKLVPKMLLRVAQTRSRELFTLTVLVIALGIAVGAAQLFGASMALGAFLAGVVVGQSEFASRAATDALPMRDAFAVLFFVSVGMMFDPTQLVPNFGLSLATIAIVVLGKPIAAFVVVRILRYPMKTALTAAVALGQIGEFSFIVGALGTKLGLLPAAANQALVVAALVSITVNPIVFRFVEPLLRRPGWQDAKSGDALSPHRETNVRSADEHRAIVVGHGPVGRILTRLLREHGVVPVVVELNIDTVKALVAEGIEAVYGDAARVETLQDAGAAHARSLVFAASGSPPAAVVRAAREVNPNIRIIARAQYLGEMAATKAAGADEVVTSEVEVAMAMAARMLDDLGASGDQRDRARDRVRHEVELALR